MVCFCISNDYGLLSAYYCVLNLFMCYLFFVFSIERLQRERERERERVEIEERSL